MRVRRVHIFLVTGIVLLIKDLIILLRETLGVTNDSSWVGSGWKCVLARIILMMLIGLLTRVLVCRLTRVLLLIRLLLVTKHRLPSYVLLILSSRLGG